MKLKGIIFAVLLAFAAVVSASAQSGTNRIYRNCSGTTAKAAVSIDASGNITATPCSGKTVTVGGTVSIPGALTVGSCTGCGGGGSDIGTAIVASAASASGFQLTTGQTNFGAVGATFTSLSTEAARQTITPVGGTLQKLFIRTTSTQDAGGTLVFTVRVNGVSSGVVVTVAAGAAAGTYSDLVNTVAVSAGDLLSIQMTNNGTGTSAQINQWSVLIK